MQKKAAIAMILGSIIFMGIVFSPAIYQQFQATSSAEIVALSKIAQVGS